MTVYLLTLKLYAPWLQNLKEKRALVKSLCHKLQNKFNISVIESDAQDLCQTAIISAVFVTKDKGQGDAYALAIQNFVEGFSDAELLDVTIEQR